jgi:hypothetical protein
MARLLKACLVATCAAVFARPATSEAQVPEREPGMRVPALVAVVDTLPPNTPRFRIMRGEQRDVILLPTDADAQLLTLAIEALRTIRSQSPPGPMLLRMRSTGDGGPRRRVLPWASRVLGDLRHASEQQVQGVGMVRAVEIWLPREASPLGQQGGGTP